jgi:integrase
MSVKALGGNRFLVRVYNPHGREYSKTVVGKQAANAHEAEVKVRMQRGTYLDPNAGKVTFRDYALQVIDARNLAPNTRRRYLRDCERLLFPAWGHRPLRSLRHTDAVQLATYCEQNAAAATAFNALVLARSVMRSAVLDGLVDRSPFLGERLGKIRTAMQPTPDWTQVAATVAAARPKTAATIQALAGTALRAGEMCGLAVGDVDWMRRTLTVRRQVQWMSDADARRAGFARGGFYATDPKTQAGGERVVPLAAWVVEALSVLAGARPGPVSVPVGAPDAAATVELDLVLGLTDPATLSQRVAVFAGRHGSRFSPHGLRRLAITTWEQGGVPLRTVQQVVGHEPQGVTMARYVRVTDESLELARRVMAAAWPDEDAGPAMTGETSRRPAAEA